MPVHLGRATPLDPEYQLRVKAGPTRTCTATDHMQEPVGQSPAPGMSLPAPPVPRPGVLRGDDRAEKGRSRDPRKQNSKNGGFWKLAGGPPFHTSNSPGRPPSVSDVQSVRTCHFNPRTGTAQGCWREFSQTRGFKRHVHPRSWVRSLTPGVGRAGPSWRLRAGGAPPLLLDGGPKALSQELQEGPISRLGPLGPQSCLRPLRSLAPRPLRAYKLGLPASPSASAPSPHHFSAWTGRPHPPSPQISLPAGSSASSFWG